MVSRQWYYTPFIFRKSSYNSPTITYIGTVYRLAMKIKWDNSWTRKWNIYRLLLLELKLYFVANVKQTQLGINLNFTLLICCKLLQFYFYKLAYQMAINTMTILNTKKVRIFWTINIAINHISILIHFVRIIWHKSFLGSKWVLNCIF